MPKEECPPRIWSLSQCALAHALAPNHVEEDYIVAMHSEAEVRRCRQLHFEIGGLRPESHRLVDAIMALVRDRSRIHHAVLATQGGDQRALCIR
jgi:hypothetical protein